MAQCWLQSAVWLGTGAIWGNFAKKPQTIDMDTWKLVESLKLHIPHQRGHYSNVKDILELSCAILGYLGHYSDFGKLSGGIINSLEFLILAFLLHEALNCFSEQVQWITLT